MRNWLVTALAAFGCAMAVPVAAQDRVTLVLNWTPSGDHAPIYYAIEQGWYRQAGVDLRLETGRGSGAAAARVGAGAELGIADLGAAMVARGAGADVVAVMGIFANSPQGFYWLKSSGIASVRDLTRRRLGNPPGDAARVMWPAIAQRSGLDANSVTWVNINPAAKPAALIAKQIDATTYFYNYHYIMEREIGADLGFASWRSLGLNMYGNAIIANGRFLRDRRAQAQAVVRTTQRAYVQCVTEPDPCIRAMASAVSGVQPSEEMQNWRLTVDALFDDEAFRNQAFGWLVPERVRADYDVVRETFEMQNRFQPEDAATNALLDTSIRLSVRRSP